MVDDFSADVAAIERIPVVPTILDVVCRTTGMGFAAIARVTEERWIACSVLDQIQFGLRAGQELKVETTICHEIRQHRDPVIINHVAEDATYRLHATPGLYGFQSYISMPVILPNGSFFGTLCAVDPQPKVLNTPEIIGMFKLFAELIALHLDAHSRLKTAHAALSREREAAELREQFIAVLGHDLRNPLMSISAGAASLVRHPERAAETATLMQRSISRMAGLIDNVLDLARGRLGGGLSITRNADEPVEPTLRQVVDEMRSIHPDRAIEVDFALDQGVSCDRARVAQLLSNLLGNALTHGAPGVPIRVCARTKDGYLELSVINGGEPIPASALGRLFQPFFRGAERPSHEGLGLGLYIASEIARAHDGVLDVKSTPAETRFTFRMPTRSGKRAPSV